MSRGEPSRVVVAVRRFASHLVPSMDDIRTHRPIIAPVVAGWLFAIASAYSLWPFVAGTLPAEQVEGVAVLFWAAASLAPVLVLLKAGVMAVLGWAILTLANSERRLRILLSVLLYGEAILAAQGIFAAGVVRVFHSGDSPSPENFSTAIGLAAFVPSSHPVLQAMAGGATLLHVAWCAFLYIAFRRAVELKRLPAGALAALFWAAIIGLAGAQASFL